MLKILESFRNKIYIINKCIYMNKEIIISVSMDNLYKLNLYKIQLYKLRFSFS